MIGLLIIFYILISTFVFGIHALDAEDEDMSPKERIVYTSFAPIVVIVLAIQLLLKLIKNKKEE